MSTLQDRPKRLLFIDLARSLAICLALTSHAFSTFQVWEQLYYQHVWITRFIIRSATPTFVVLFGIMLELVYYRHLQSKGWTSVAPRLIFRSIQCYACYFFTGCVALIAGVMTLSEASLAFLFMGRIMHGSILKFYVLAMLAALPLLYARRRLGWGAPILIVTASSIFVTLRPLVEWPSPDQPLAYLTGLLVGSPIGMDDISFLHYLTFIAAGMLIGRALVQSTISHDWRPWLLACVCTYAVGCSVIAYLATQESLKDVLIEYARTYRFRNHPGYYAIGTCLAVTVIIACSVATRPTKNIPRIFAPMMVFGRNALLAFTIGNCLLILWPPHLNGEAFFGIVMTLLILILLGLILGGMERFMTSRKVKATNSAKSANMSRGNSSDLPSGPPAGPPNLLP